jgi:hypothetical protein
MRRCWPTTHHPLLHNDNGGLIASLGGDSTEQNVGIRQMRWLPNGVLENAAKGINRTGPRMRKERRSGAGLISRRVQTWHFARSSTRRSHQTSPGWNRTVSILFRFQVLSVPSNHIRHVCHRSIMPDILVISPSRVAAYPALYSLLAFYGSLSLLVAVGASL